jgi:putative transposase
VLASCGNWWSAGSRAATSWRCSWTAKAALGRLKPELALVNRSAAASLEEGLEETLTLHRLGLFRELGRNLKTTNCLESILARVERRTRKVTRWRNSDQKQRWLATALLDLEPRQRGGEGLRRLPRLRQALRASLDSRRVDVA